MYRLTANLVCIVIKINLVGINFLRFAAVLKGRGQIFTIKFGNNGFCHERTESKAHDAVGWRSGPKVCWLKSKPFLHPMKKSFLFFLPLFLLVFLSCTNTRRAVYFADLPLTTSFDEALIPEHIIKQKDVLSISVSSLNEAAAAVFNRPNRTDVQSTTPTGELVQPAGYLVDQDGYIRFPQIGLIKAEGLTKKQLEEFLRNALVTRKLLYDPIIAIRVLNYRVTVLGEVARPTVVNVPAERITLLEALGLAGDVTIFAKRNNILVIREEAGKRITQRVDLNSSELFKSPYYHLKSNDVVYVEPNKARVFSATRTNQLLPAIISSISVLVIMIDRLTR